MYCNCLPDGTSSCSLSNWLLDVVGVGILGDLSDKIISTVRSDILQMPNGLRQTLLRQLNRAVIGDAKQ